MYLAHRSGGWPMQNLLWQYVREAVLVFHELGPEETTRLSVLMEQYQDTPMDLADTSLMATAEGLGLAENHHFQVYRLNGSRPFVIIG